MQIILDAINSIFWHLEMIQSQLIRIVQYLMYTLHFNTLILSIQSYLVHSGFFFKYRSDLNAN